MDQISKHPRVPRLRKHEMGPLTTPLSNKKK